MLPIKQALAYDQRELLALYAKLSEADRHSLMSFGRFLASQDSAEPEAESLEQVSERPLDIPRPENESVVKAIRRLSKTYPMLEKKNLIDGASVLMSAHVLQGRPADQVINELELLFEEHYTVFVSGND